MQLIKLCIYYISSRQRCLVRIPVIAASESTRLIGWAMSGIGLPRAGTGRWSPRCACWVRNPGPVIDPDLLWWRSRGPQSVRRQPAPEWIVRRRVREEDVHVRRYLAALGAGSWRTWRVLQGSHPSYEFVVVPSLWVVTFRRTRRCLLY